MAREQCWILLGGVNELLWWGRMRRETIGDPASVSFNPHYILQREEKRGDVIGMFHTHPSFYASPSDRDHRTMRQWVSCLGKPLVCVIDGIDGLRAYWYMDDESDPIEASAVKELDNHIVGVTTGVRTAKSLGDCE